jgi:hypothetical protein
MNATTALATLHARRSETARGRAAVEALEAERAAASTAYSSEMSAMNLQVLEQVDRKAAKAKLDLEAFSLRERAAQAAHDQEQLAMKREQLRDLLVQADTDRLFAELRPLTDEVVDQDRAIARVISTARTKCAAQREAVEQAQALARELGERDAFAIEPTYLDDFRCAVGQAIARARAAEGRARTRSELFLFAIDHQPPPGEKIEVTIPIVTHDGFAFSARILDVPKGKS